MPPSPPGGIVASGAIQLIPGAADEGVTTPAPGLLIGHMDVTMKLPLKTSAHAVDGPCVPTTQPDALPGATLTPGWYPDPHLRWKARYWDGRFWTERVAAPGQALPVFGQDPVVPPERTDADVAPTLARLADAVRTAELAHLRTELETWRGVAEERGRVLTSALNALESLAARGERTPPEPVRSVEASRTASLRLETGPPPAPPERPAGAGAPAARSSRVTVPDAVRTAALSELLTMTSKQRPWWQRSSDLLHRL